MTSVHQSN